MKVYISHNFAAREWLQTYVAAIEAAGHTVVSRWLTEPTIHDRNLGSVMDIQDVRACDTLILFADNFGDRPGRGKYVEFGAALAWGKRCIVVCRGDDNCIFYALPNMRHAESAEEAIILI